MPSERTPDELLANTACPTTIHVPAVRDTLATAFVVPLERLVDEDDSSDCLAPMFAAVSVPAQVTSPSASTVKASERLPSSSPLPTTKMLCVSAVCDIPP